MIDSNELFDINRKAIKEFRENEGRVGGPLEGAPMVLVHHTGAKSGTERIAPLAYYTEDGRLYIFASEGGTPTNPDWFHNLVANPKITVELGTETFPVVARLLEGAERDDIYAKQSVAMPQFAEYQRNTTRIIPVFELVRETA